MPEAAFVLSAAHDPSVLDLVQTLRFELELQAVPSAVHVGSFPEARPERVYILPDPWTYVVAEGEAALPDDSVLGRTIFLVAEGHLDAGDAAYRALLLLAGDRFVCDPRRRLALERLGVPSRLLRLGYSASLDHFDAAAERPIDVAFLGERTERRTRHLARAASVLARSRSVIHLSDTATGRNEPGTLLGQERWPLLAQTKVVINLHGGAETALEWRRVVDAVHAGAVVVTEHSHGIAPFVPGQHLLTASADALPFVVDRLLCDQARLVQMRGAAHDRLRSWLPYAFPVSMLRAAMVELVGEPVAEGASLGAPRGVSPTSDHVSPAPDGGPPPPAPAPEVGAWEPPEAEVLAETPGWAATTAPEVTVLVAAGGAAQELALSLEGLVVSRFSDFEAVIAISGPDSPSREPAQQWIAAHPFVPVRLVAAPEPAAPGALRDGALSAARAPLCLVLDAGQGMYPRCLEVLTDVLRSDPEIAFAYPIQEVAGEDLTSWRGWEAWLASPGNDLHTPALIRAEALQALGSFPASDRELFVRLATRGWRGTLVPEPLARSRPSQAVSVVAL
ncbi:MAG: hypothetical protein ACJ780_03295 [Solirubrobacteraceae bacterium]